MNLLFNILNVFNGAYLCVPRGWGSLAGCRLWGGTELDTTEVT